MSRRVAIRGSAYVLVAVAAWTFVHVARPPTSGVLVTAAFDAGHVPTFGILALAILGLLRLRSWRRPAAPYWVAAALAIALGVVSELVQLPGPRNADPLDAARNALGAVAFLCGAAAVSRLRRRRPGALVRAAVATAIVAVSFAPLLATYADLAARDEAFPELCEFERGWLDRFWELHGADLEIVELPAPWGDGRSRAAKLVLHAVPWPTVVLREPQPDWSGYDALVFSVASTNEEPFVLHVRVDDDLANRRGERFHRGMTVVPGANHYRVPLDEMTIPPDGTPLDLRAVRRIVWYAASPGKRAAVYLHDVRLVREAGETASEAPRSRRGAPGTFDGASPR